MADTEYNLKLNITANNEASKELDDVWKKTEDLQKKTFELSESTQKTIKAVWVTAGAVTASVVAMGKKSIDAAGVQIEAETKLATVLRQRTNATDEQIESIKRLASAQQELWIIWDEVQLSWLQQLWTFVTQTETLEKLAPAMNNLIAQQKWYNATTWDAINVGNLMGKVLQGQTWALTKCWISFSEAQEEILKFWTEEERAATLAQVITDNVWEMNQALADTFQGRMTQLNNTIWDIRESIWMALIPALQMVLEKIVPIINTIWEWIAENPKLTSTIIIAVWAVSGLIAIFSALALAMPWIMTAISLLSWPIWVIIGAIWLLAVARTNDRWGIRETTAKAVDDIKWYLEPFIQRGKDAWQKYGDDILLYTRTAREWIKEIWDFAMDAISWALLLWWDTIKLWFDAFYGLITWDWSAFSDQLITLWLNLDQTLTETFWDMRTNIKNGFKAWFDYCAGILQNLADFVSQVVDGIRNARNNVKNSVSNFASEWIRQVKSILSFNSDGERAIWWPVTMGKTYLVWEKWPELFTPNTSWTITPNNEIINNNGVTVNISWVSVRNDSDITAIADEIIRQIKLEKDFWIA